MKQSEWFSTKEKMPELPEGEHSRITVIAVQEGRDVSPMIYERTLVDGKIVYRWLYPWGSVAHIEITHWKPFN